MTSAKVLHGHRWADLPERGNPASLRLIAWIAVRIGRRTARLLLYPITLYFVVTANAARRVSNEYLKRLRARMPHWWEIFKHFYFFGSTILDRIFLLRGEFDRFDVTVHGRDLVHTQIEKGKGCLLMGSHLGSFEVLRAIGVTQQDFPLKVLMDIEHNQNISRFFDELNPKIAATVIEPDRPDSLLRVRESLDGGYFVGLLGDRATANDKTTHCQFLGATAEFPAGPILLAAVMHCPIILFFGLYRGGKRYEIYFEHFADDIVLNRDRRAENVQSWMQRYVERLEYYTRRAPYNWFNFYPFWDQESPK